MLNIKLPALYCPFPSAINQYASAAYQHNLDWLRFFNIVIDESTFPSCRALKATSDLVARTYPTISLEALEVITDLLVWYLIFDDQFEKAGTSKQPELLEPEHARLVDVMKGAFLTDDDTPAALTLGDILQRLHQLPHGTSELVLRFTKNLEDFLQGVRWEALNHSQGITPDLTSYMKMRVFTSGVYPCFDLILIAEQISLPPEVISHPIVKRLDLAANHVISWVNDILSVKKEIREGNTHNLVLVLQHEYQLSLQEAVERAASLHNAEVQTFIELSAQLPSFGAEIDGELQRYLSGMRFWMRGCLDWSLESERYQISQAA